MMKKNLAVFMMAVMMAGLLAGCGKKEEEAAADGTENAEDTTGGYLADLNADEYVALGDYKGVEVSLAAVEVTEEDKEATIENILVSYPMATEITGAAEDGDEVNIDFAGKKDGVAFEGGTGTDHTLVLGSNTFITELEQGIVGMKKGDVKDIPVTFPENYKSADLAGQDAVFTVTMNSVSRYPEKQELTDEYVTWLTAGEQTTVDEFHTVIGESLLQEAQSFQDTEKQSIIANTIVTNSEFRDLPEKFVERIKSAMTSNLTSYASMYGMDLNAYMVYTNMMEDGQDATNVIAEQSETTARRYLAFQVIANQEDLNISDTELEESLTAAAEAAGTTVEEYEAGVDKAGYREFLMLEKVMKFVEENAVITIG